jgi:hypothetical protein
VPWHEIAGSWLEERPRVTDAAKRLAGQKFMEAADTFHGQARPDRLVRSADTPGERCGRTIAPRRVRRAS